MAPVKSRRGLSGNQLKLIAAVSMLADHVGYLIVGNGIWLPLSEQDPSAAFWKYVYRGLHLAGRMAFPIFCFLLVEGYFHTRSRKRYALRLGIFALLSEVPFDLMSAERVADWEQQSVMLTLFLGFLMIWFLEWIGKQAVVRGYMASAMFGELTMVMQLAVIAAFCWIAWIMRMDYDYGGIMLIALLYWFRSRPAEQCIVGFIWLALALQTWYYMPGLALGFLAISCYNGTRGRYRGIHYFYLFYPLHMLMLVGIYHLIF